MPYFALFYEVVNDFEAKCAAFRQDHLRYARQAHACGELFLAGALANPEGALLVFHTEDRAVAESFARHNGLVGRWEIRPWTVVKESRHRRRVCPFRFRRCRALSLHP